LQRASLMSELPVVRSLAARSFFLVAALTTIGCLYFTQYVGVFAASRWLTPIFSELFAYYDFLGSMGLLSILIVAIFVSARLPAGHILRWFGSHVLSVAGACVLALGAGALAVYRNHPLSMDEYAAYFQSQVFAAGRLAGQYPPALLDWLIPRGFQDYFLFVSRQTGAVASGYWPAFSLLLSGFTALGIPWACNPIISGLTVLVIHRLALQIFDDVEAAGAAVLFTIASPVFFADGISYYAMQAHLLANSVYLLLLLRPTVMRAVLAGIVGSIALTLHNPVPHMLFAAPCWLFIARRSDAAKLVPALAVGYLPLSLLLGVGWVRFYTHLTQEGQVMALDTSDWLAPLTRFSGAFSFPNSTAVLARVVGVAKIWLWAVPGLMWLACIGAWKWRANSACRLLAQCALVTLAGYLLVPDDQGHGWGYRYFHSAWMALPLLGAGALSGALAGSLREPLARVFVVACALLSLVLGVGQRAQQIHEIVTRSLRHLPSQHCPEPCVLFVNLLAAQYEGDLIQNDPWLRGETVRMVSSTADVNAELMSQLYPQMHRIDWGPFGEAWSASSSPAAPAGR
jgi:hypothetical protein